MQTEFEIKILDIDKAETLDRLKELGLKEGAIQNFRRYVYDLDTTGAWIRLRTDGTTTTLTYKNFEKNSIDGMQELEVNVSSFEDAHEMLQLAGLKPSSYQENRRHLFSGKDVEISLDEWPLIPPYVEIEAKDTATVEDYISLLQYANHRTTSEPTSAVYKIYGQDLTTHKRLSFDTENL